MIASTREGDERVAAILPRANYGFDYRLLDWSPDSRSLAVAHSSAPERPVGILILDLDTGAQRTLTNPGNDVLGDVDPRFSPDGSSVSFIRLFHRSQQELFSVPFNGGEPKPLTSDRTRISSHGWTRDGGIVFAGDRGGEFRLWRLHPSGVRPVRPLPIYAEFPIQLAAARRSDVLVYSVLHQDRNIWALDLATRRWTRMIASTAQDASPQYSPDGLRISFRSDRSGEEQLWVTDAAGANPVQVTRGGVRPSVGRWGPDSRSLVFNDPRTAGIFVAREQDSGRWDVHPVPQATGVHPVFSPDGRWIYAGSTSALLRIPVAGGPAEVIAAGRSEAPAPSLDGARLFFLREPTSTALWQVSFAGRSVSRVLDGLLPGCSSCWAAAPTGIYYLGADPESFDRQALYFHSFS
ncbi:MAG TPA: hypothetical protein VHM16_01810, partial [Rubrobacteraceae bacterium]|nr:hypothetical protein [Rubrobacteraceae bacterium]